MATYPRPIPSCLLLVAVVSCSVSCGEKNAYVAPAPEAVDVQKPLVQTLTVYREFPARTEPYKKYEVRARVTGFLSEIKFDDGSYVQKDDALFVIDPVQFDIAVDTATATLEKEQAELALATKNYEKRKEASKSGAVSEIDVATAEAEMKVAAAKVSIAQAALEDAEAEKGYTLINSRIDGRVSRRLVDEGNLVSGTQATLLATVVQDNPIFVTFEANEREILDKLADRPSRQGARLSGKATELKLRLVKTDGNPHPALGRFHALANEFDTGTGTISVTAEFGNDDHSLAAGLSVKLGVPQELEDAIFIPLGVVQRDPAGTYVMVLDEENKAARRVVRLSDFIEGQLVVVEAGVGADDRIIINNLQRVRDGAPVNPTEVPPPTIPQPAPGVEGGGGPAPGGGGQN